MNRKLSLALLLLMSSAGAASTPSNSPLGVLRNADLIHRVHFQDQRTNYTIWRFQGSGQANMQGLFMNKARPRSEANLVKTVQLSLLSPTQTFRPSQLRTLQKAAEEVSSKCFGNDLKNLDLFLKAAVNTRAWPSVTRGKTTEITVVPAGEGARVTVQLDLPDGQTSQCRMPSV